MKKVLVLGTIMALAVVTAASGCLVSATPSGTVSYSYGGYTPYYYYGNLVYFDSFGRPYYYRSGMQMFIPSTWVNYGAATSYWRVNRVRYNRWHTRYHRPSYYRRPVRSRNYRRRGTVRHTRRGHVRTTRRTTRTVRVRRRR
ncbi:hypothetical protein KKF84_18790 [Myxococcota bacterium]|nr:hypothetical protein [Myxococcota bacterium]MBU1537370.1 hypothetical protein [Myxococcota bacterium]